MKKEKAKGRELTEMELEQAVGGVALREGSVAPAAVAGLITPAASAGVADPDALAIQMGVQTESAMVTSASNVRKKQQDCTNNSTSNIG